MMGRLPILQLSLVTHLVGRAAVICGIPSPVVAEDLEHIEWCAEDGERLSIERQGLGFNEHTVCSTRFWQLEGAKLTTVQDCENIYVSDDGVVTRIDQRTLSIQIIFDGPDKLSLRENTEPEMIYGRCRG